MIKNCIKIIIAAIISILIPSLFSLQYSYTGVHIDNDTGASDYKWLPGKLKSNMTEGFTWLRMDEGFNNSYKSKADHGELLLMGSSHMEVFHIFRSLQAVPAA